MKSQALNVSPTGDGVQREKRRILHVPNHSPGRWHPESRQENKSGRKTRDLFPISWEKCPKLLSCGREKSDQSDERNCLFEEK